MIDATVYPLLAEHTRGDSYRVIGERHGISQEHARQAVIRDGRRYVDGVELDLLVAWKLTQQKRDAEAECPTLVLPHQAQDGWQLGLSLLQAGTD